MPLLAAVVAVVLAALPWQAMAARSAPAAAGPFKTTLTAAQMTGKQAVLDTSMGTVVIDLRPDLAPNHVGYMMRLAGDGAYNGTIFHRIVKRGIVQGNDINHVKGIVSMARGDDPASATTSFFIVTGAAPSLDGKYTAFGRVVDGMDVVEKVRIIHQ
jgi:cyclophilin family peptidyl-prolyl cis-trans isomerase